MEGEAVAFHPRLRYWLKLRFNGKKKRYYMCLVLVYFKHF